LMTHPGVYTMDVESGQPFGACNQKSVVNMRYYVTRRSSGTMESMIASLVQVQDGPFCFPEDTMNYSLIAKKREKPFVAGATFPQEVHILREPFARTVRRAPVNAMIITDAVWLRSTPLNHVVVEGKRLMLYTQGVIYETQCFVPKVVVLGAHDKGLKENGMIGIAATAVPLHYPYYLIAAETKVLEAVLVKLVEANKIVPINVKPEQRALVELKGFPLTDQNSRKYSISSTPWDSFDTFTCVSSDRRKFVYGMPVACTLEYVLILQTGTAKCIDFPVKPKSIKISDTHCAATFCAVGKYVFRYCGSTVVMMVGRPGYVVDRVESYNGEELRVFSYAEMLVKYSWIQRDPPKRRIWEESDYDQGVMEAIVVPTDPPDHV